ncbi:unnamed protein product [Spirodela intermedia]|uniref:Uncharacterized protein n=2 Tax=Spirodela intermedia TaxID=51605 RepID=A0A7I8JSC6_SPIIN|nr:unnamed protein product [Spirodela intermedia]CAA6673029.1 unnamed protein product [Spirodela intermedia]CAA7410240.1 unnamed protein product [Spirodela intermedia]
MRLRKVAQRATPKVCAPERATSSRRFSPWLAKLEMSAERLDDGPGRLLLAALWLAVLASLRPRGTVHEGPPLCMEEGSQYPLVKEWTRSM